jgi:hypothetical protein
MVGGPLSHYAINKGGGRQALDARFTWAITPHRYSPSRSERGAASDRKPPSSSSSPLRHHFTSLPPSPQSVAAGVQMAPANETTVGASTTPTALTTTTLDGLRSRTPPLSFLPLYSLCIRIYICTVNHELVFLQWCTRSNEPKKREI